MQFFKLHDADASLKAPMIREVRGACLNFNGNNLDEFGIRSWKNQFESAIQCASRNFSFFPEPIDFFHVNDPDLPGAVRETPFIVYSYPTKYCEVEPIDPKEAARTFSITSMVMKIGKELNNIVRSLHGDQHNQDNQARLVLRQCPLRDLRRLQTTNALFIGEFFSLASQGNSGFNPATPFFSLKREYSAPECFSISGELSEATDMYVIAKTILMNFGVTFDVNPFPDPTVIDRILQAMQKRYKFKMPDHMIRYFKVSLNSSPANRFKNMGEAYGHLTNKDYIKPPEPGVSPSRPQNPPPQQKPVSRKKGRF
ncbi:MAG: hypothetical protein HQM09_22150 [Candidatus Riflebacteria bacterium]|nr:hypothetical protein [Candidatus Riflebacteria bacterium]